MKITMTMEEEIARIVKQATEFYARVGCGQYWVIPHMVSRVRREHRNKLPCQDDVETIRRLNSALEEAKQLQFPELGMHQSHGLGFSRETDIAFNTYYAISFALNHEDRDRPFESIPYPKIVSVGTEKVRQHEDHSDDG